MANNLANEARARAETARRELYRAMKESKLTTFDHSFTVTGVSYSVSAKVGTQNRYTVNVGRLRKEIGDDQVLAVCTVSQATINEQFGTNVRDQVVEASDTAENVMVRAKK